jgi:3-deoxy-D-manno-octulosonate 8-phosphate phosphatase (KDO 8-P phosphatase)
MNTIACMVFDVDGVLTDGGITITDAGDEIKTFNSRDGHGIKLLIRAGIQVAIITGRTSRVVEHRARELGIRHVIQGSKDKRASLVELAGLMGIDPSGMAFMGDDVVDLPAMELWRAVLRPGGRGGGGQAPLRCGHRPRGGRGAAREAVEILLKRLGLYEKAMERYGA